MGLVHSPFTVMDGLVLHLDAGNVRSYPGSGTTWTDLSRRGNNGVLSTTAARGQPPVYSNQNGGCILFDTDDYVNCGNPSIATGKLTVNAWIKIEIGSINQHIVDSSNNSWHLAILDNNKPYFWNGSTYHQNTSSLSTGVWYMITGVQGTTLDLYINGILSESIASDQNLTTNNVNLGRWQSGTRLFQGRIAQVQIYNRALTAAEISQNFNALRGRYGI